MSPERKRLKIDRRWYLHFRKGRLDHNGRPIKIVPFKQWVAARAAGKLSPADLEHAEHVNAGVYAARAWCLRKWPSPRPGFPWAPDRGLAA